MTGTGAALAPQSVGPQRPLCSRRSFWKPRSPATTANWGAFGASLAAAVGLLFARDNNKTSEDVGAK
jgi:hypothetical protein